MVHFFGTAGHGSRDAEQIRIDDGNDNHGEDGKRNKKDCLFKKDSPFLYYEKTSAN